MYFVLVLFAFAIRATESQRLKKDILAYFNSDGVYYFRREWGHHRRAMENAIANALQETIGRQSMNVLTMRTSGLKLAKGLYHNHGRVQIILVDSELVELPHCWLPDVSLSLAANVLKFETRLTKMIVTADYVVMRNKSDIITDIKEQDPFKNTPFLFHPVQSMGRLALSLEGCMLSGYVITRISGTSINVGHHKFTLTKCDYTVEIHQPGEGSPPVIARFSAKMPATHFGIKHLVLKPLQEEFVLKLQGALFSFINTTAVFAENLRALEDDQILIFRKVESNLTYMVRDLNKKTAMINAGAFDIEDFFITWDDFTPYDLNDFVPGLKGRGGIKITNMVLTGLDTAYISNSGGPYKLDSVMIGEQIRFSSLQVRGDVYYSKYERDHFRFAVEIRDYAVNIDVDVEGEEPIKIEVAGYRKMEFTERRLAFKPAEAIITGHLMNMIPRYLSRIIKIDISKDYPERLITLPLGEPLVNEDSEGDTSAGSEGGPAKKRLRAFHRGEKQLRLTQERKGHEHVTNNEITEG